MTTIQDVVRNDTGFDLNFTLKNKKTGAITDLTGNSAIKFKMALPDASVNKINGACTVINATAGTCKYTVQSGDMDTVGVYNAEIEVTYTGGKIVTGKGFVINVVEDLPAV